MAKLTKKQSFIFFNNILTLIDLINQCVLFSELETFRRITLKKFRLTQIDEQTKNTLLQTIEKKQKELINND